MPGRSRGSGQQAGVDDGGQLRVQPRPQPTHGYGGPLELLVTHGQRPERWSPGGRRVERPAEPPRVGGRRDQAAARLLGRHLLAGPEARPHLARGPGDAEVDERRLAAVGHHVGGPDVEVQVPLRVQVVQGGGQLPAEVGQVGRRQPTGALDLQPGHELLEGVAHQGLHDHHRHRLADGLERPWQVRVRHRLQQVSLQQQPLPDPLHVGAVGADRLGHGAAQPAPGEHGVHVQGLPAREQLLDDVAGCHLLALGQHPGFRRDRRDRHRATTVPRASDHSRA